MRRMFGAMEMVGSGVRDVGLYARLSSNLRSQRMGAERPIVSDSELVNRLWKDGKLKGLFLGFRAAKGQNPVGETIGHAMSRGDKILALGELVGLRFPMVGSGATMASFLRGLGTKSDGIETNRRNKDPIQSLSFWLAVRIKLEREHDELNR